MVTCIKFIVYVFALYLWMTKISIAVRCVKMYCTHMCVCILNYWKLSVKIQNQKCYTSFRKEKHEHSFSHYQSMQMHLLKKLFIHLVLGRQVYHLHRYLFNYISILLYCYTTVIKIEHKLLPLVIGHFQQIYLTKPKWFTITWGYM